VTYQGTILLDPHRHPSIGLSSLRSFSILRCVSWFSVWGTTFLLGDKVEEERTGFFLDLSVFVAWGNGFLEVSAGLCHLTSRIFES
jgi:hypothetical protein